jgi:hypothetical protein
MSLQLVQFDCGQGHALQGYIGGSDNDALFSCPSRREHDRVYSTRVYSGTMCHFLISFVSQTSQENKEMEVQRQPEKKKSGSPHKKNKFIR